MSFSDLLGWVLNYWFLILIAIFIILAYHFHIQSEADNRARKKFLDYEKQLKRYEESLKEQYEQQQAKLRAREIALSAKESHLNDLVRMRMTETVQDISEREYLVDTPAFKAVHDTSPDGFNRTYSALTRDITICEPFDITCEILSKSGNHYRTSLYSCTCEDFQFRHIPCKHMRRLAVEIGALIAYDTSDIENHLASMIHKIAVFEGEVDDFEHRGKELQSREAALTKLLESKQQTYPWFSKVYADFLSTYDDELIQYLQTKAHPAEQASKVINSVKKEKNALVKKLKQREYQLNYLMSLFPWLETFMEAPPIEAFQSYHDIILDDTEKTEYDVLSKWLSPEEYQKLNHVEKYQLALDRYCKRQKSTWEVGIEYERYIGYLCENRGYIVYYNGATKNLEDMGRDLLISQGDILIAIQCKRWAREKQIHENHVFQLCGSVLELQAQYPDRKVSGTFVTTTSFSEIAKACAGKLSISLYPDIPFKKYPLIKCNISRSGEKIYHLPFDLQYDRVQITPNKGDFYASTVADAESAGFRRAHKWITF